MRKLLEAKPRVACSLIRGEPRSLLACVVMVIPLLAQGRGGAGGQGGQGGKPAAACSVRSAHWARRS